MSKIKLIAAALALFVTFMTAQAQEKTTAADVFQWFPMDSYRTLGYADLARLKEAESYTLFKELFGNSGIAFNEDNPLPDSLKEEVESLIVAQISKVEIVEEESEGTESESIDEPEKHARPMNVGGMLWVFRFADTETALKTALEKGQISRAGLRINERPVYKLIARETDESQKDYFAYATLTNELLVAEDLDQLGGMIKAGMGLELGLLDDFEYSDLEPYIRELDHSWEVTPHRVRTREQIEGRRAQGEAEEKLQELEKSLETDLIYEIENYKVSEVIAISRIAIYGDEEVAKEEMEKLTGELARASQELNEEMDSDKDLSGDKELKPKEKMLVKKALGFVGNLLESNETTIDGPVVTTTFIFGKKQLANLQFLLSMAKAMEEKHDKDQEGFEEK